ncbi:MAG TPA: flavin reductase family protein [Rhodothermales bacterium]
MTDSVEGDLLRSVMRHVPSPVTVVTAADAQERRGITIGSFASTSLDPPLISFNVSRNAQIFPLMERVDRFAVHVLSEDQARIGNQFSLPDVPAEEQFTGIEFLTDTHGVPILSGAVSVISCRKHSVLDAGDHIIVLGEVTRIDVEPARRPVVYYDRNYHTIGTIADATLFDPLQDAGKAGSEASG